MAFSPKDREMVPSNLRAFQGACPLRNRVVRRGTRASFSGRTYLGFRHRPSSSMDPPGPNVTVADRGCENAFILDSECKLQVLAL